MLPVNQNLKKLRTATMYSQETFAEVLCCNRNNVCSYEQGVCGVPFSVVKSAFDHFSLPKDLLYDFIWNPELIIERPGTKKPNGPKIILSVDK